MHAGIDIETNQALEALQVESPCSVKGVAEMMNTPLALSSIRWPGMVRLR
jgi:hypothetical protein